MVVLVVTVGLTSCGKDDPVRPNEPIDVNGLWNFVGEVTKNTCNFDPGSPHTSSLTFSQTGAVVSTPRVYFNFGPDFVYQGTVNGTTVSMASQEPYVIADDDGVVHLDSGIEIADIEDNSGNGSLKITSTVIQGGNGSDGCQIIWTGIWTKQ